MTKSKSKDVPGSSSRKRKAGAVASSSALDAEELAVHEDAVTILNAAVEYRSKNNGSISSRSAMEPLFRNIKDSLHEKLTSVDQLHNKLRTLKRKYRRACEEGVGATPSDRAFYELSVKAWGDEAKLKKEEKEKEKEKEKKGKEKEKVKTASPMDVDDEGADEAEVEEEDGDGSNSFKHLAAQASKFWPQMGLPTEILELGLQSMDKRKAAVSEKKWRAFLEVELKNITRSHELNREIYTSLLGGLNSKRNS